MALPNAFYPHSIRLPSPELTHFSSLRPDMGYQMVTQAVAGQPVPCFVGVGNVTPTIEFTTQQIKSIFDTCTAAALARDLSAGTVELYYRAGKPMEIRELDGALVHAKAQLANSAMLYWSSLNVTQGEVAEVTASLVTARRGGADPMVWVGNTALPANSGCQNLYGLGPVLLNGVQLEGVTGVNVSTNVQLEPIRSDGEPTPTYNGIRSFHTQVELQSNNLDEITGATFGGDEFTTLEVFLRRMATTNVYDAVSVASSIKLTFYGGIKTVSSVSGTPAQVNPMFYTIDDGTNPPHAIDTAIAISPP